MFPLRLKLSCSLRISVYTLKRLYKCTAKYLQSCQTSVVEIFAKYSTAKKHYNRCLIGFLTYTFGSLIQHQNFSISSNITVRLTFIMISTNFDNAIFAIFFTCNTTQSQVTTKLRTLLQDTAMSKQYLLTNQELFYYYFLTSQSSMETPKQKSSMRKACFFHNLKFAQM